MPSLLVTVGSTKFPALTDYIIQPHTLSALLAAGITHVTIQHGTHPLPNVTPPHPLKICTISYTRDFFSLLSEADLVISHAGSGTVLETLACAKPLLVVVNSELMDNHQIELASAMARSGCCQLLQDSHLSRLITTLESLIQSPCPVKPPTRQPRVFAALVADEIDQADDHAVERIALIE